MANIDTTTEHPWELYPQLLQEHKREVKSGRENWKQQWWKMSPTGNIYRLRGLQRKKKHISEDLWMQLRDLADKHAALLKPSPGEDDNKTSAEVLLDALKKTTTKSDESPSVGYPPLEAFLDTPVFKYGPFLLYGWEAEDCGLLFMKSMFLTLITFSVQLFAPLLVLILSWQSNANLLRYHFTVASDAQCLPNAPVLFTILGFGFLVVVLCILRSSVAEEAEGDAKEIKISVGGFWFCLGWFINAWTTVMLAIAMPLVFWTEINPQSLVLDVMGFFFLLNLDDLAGDVFSYMKISDEDFVKDQATIQVLMGMCPVWLEDLINPQAQDKANLWSICLDANGRLLNAKKERCMVRLDAAPADETKTLLGGPVEYVYRHREDAWLLPRIYGRVAIVLWWLIDGFFMLMQALVPLGFLVLSLMCRTGSPVK